MEEFKEAPPEQIAAPGEAAAVPRQAASIVVLRGGADALELLLVQRTHLARFMAGVWVFPGGAVDAAEGHGDPAHRAAAVRELREEAGIDLEGSGGAASLVKYSQWITPAIVRTRFDTHFFLATLPEGQAPMIDGDEIVDMAWFTPQGALDAHQENRLDLVFPTIKHLEQFAAFPSAQALLDHAATTEVVPVTPVVVMEGEIARVVLPGDEGYEAPEG